MAYHEITLPENVQNVTTAWRNNRLVISYQDNHPSDTEQTTKRPIPPKRKRNAIDKNILRKIADIYEEYPETTYDTLSEKTGLSKSTITHNRMIQSVILHHVESSRLDASLRYANNHGDYNSNDHERDF